VKYMQLFLLSGAFTLVPRLRPLKLKSLLAVGLGVLLHALAGTSVALAGHHPMPDSEGGNATMLLFLVGIVTLAMAGLTSYLLWNKRRSRSLRRGHRSSTLRKR
jgi:drug/metabolite transporter (DMT)-like permease